MKIKKETWLDSIIEAFKYLGGDAKYKELYPVVKQIRISKGLSWTDKSEQSIQATIEDNSFDSIRNKRPNKSNIFVKYARGHWGLRSYYIDEDIKMDILVNDDINSLINENNITNFEYKCKPQKIIETTIKNNKKLLLRDKGKALNALVKANFQCEANCGNKLFKRKNSDKDYTEVHHLIPTKYYKNFEFSLDIEENLVSLCSHCHNLLHYGNDPSVILKKLYDKRKKLLELCGINISFEELLKMYK